jgi:serine/threonine protein kinase/class 3 adenylate cyclase
MSFERYRLLAQLGAGSDGMAYRAVAGDGSTLVEVIDLSRARSDAGRWGELVRRLRTAGELQDRSVIRVIELGLAADPPYVVLEWAGTETLAAAAGQSGTKLRDRAIELARDLAGALKATHRLGLAHGRLSPARVLLVDGVRPKVDFTGAEVGFPALSETTRALEQACRDGDPGVSPAALRAADLFGLGTVLSWLLSGQLQQGPGGTGLEPSSSVRGLLDRLLASDPAERPSAREVEEQLAGLVAPLDATGNWERSGETVARSMITVRSERSDSVASLTGSSRVGRYHLLEKLGEGGQGVVYRAQDPADSSVVAIKILRANRVDNSDVLRRFRKEARLMAEANNPFVVNLLEFNDEDGLPYMVLEYVDGLGLDQLLGTRKRLDERTALAIMADVARGLMEAHERGIVHRDIKPANILLQDPRSAVTVPIGETIELGPGPSTGATESGIVSVDTGNVPRQVKISDFGLARHVVDTESLAMTAAGALLGTPHYMSPEQWTGQAVDPRTDVYAMGATLFHLLAGRPPFAAQTRDLLCAQHCNEPPPHLATLNPDVSDGVVRLVDRALSKRPEDRFVDGGAMLRELEALLHGKPSDLAIHPRLPRCDPHRLLEFEFRWELESTPRQLWPLVTNTDRLDRAIGFPPVRYTSRYEPGRGVRTFVEGRKAGTIEVGEEHPYEWVEPRRMGVLREYSQGPFRWLVSVVELLPRPGGGTTLVHRLRLEPSSWKVRVGSRWGVGVGLRKNLERVYRRIDAAVQSGMRRGVASGADPFREPDPIPGPRRQRLDRLLDRLVEHGIDPSITMRLGEHLTLGSAQEIARIRPLALAELWGLDPDQVTAACLRGASEGLLELHWDLLCPVCRISCKVTDTLRAIGEHGHCEACHLDFQLDFANSIELIFRVHPEIRAADLGIYCIGGPAHSPHVLAQVRVAPGERIELDLELAEGSYRLRGPQLPWSADFQVQRAATIRRWDIELLSGPAPEGPPALRAGAQALILRNGHDQELVVRVERSAPRSDALTAARAASLALFRELFPGEILAPGQLATVSTATLLVTALDVDQADALYNDLDDARAFNVIHEHFERLGAAVRAGGGAVVKTVGEGMLASFGDVTAAVETALKLPQVLAASAATRTLRLRAGVHRGRMLAATLNDQLDYFGTTARQATAILRYARGDALVLTRAVASDPEVGALLHARRIESEVVPTDLAGHPHVIRICLSNQRDSSICGH